MKTALVANSMSIENSCSRCLWWNWTGMIISSFPLTDVPIKSNLHCCPIQPLSLLLKACPLVDELALYDVVNTPGVAADLSHISSVAVRDISNRPCVSLAALFSNMVGRNSLVTCPRTTA